MIKIYSMNLDNEYCPLTCTNIYSACIRAGAPCELLQLDKSATMEKFA